MAVIDTTKDIAALFELQAQTTPNAVALEDESRSLTYAELDSETWALADRLRQHGVGRDHLVGVLMGRSADYVVASLAALRAGGAFLVLELAYPSGLLRDVIEDAKPSVIITQAAHAGSIQADVPIILIGPRSPHLVAQTPILHEMKPPLPAEDDLERLAFVSYSSGTTGQPKGIANPHRAAVGSYALRFRLSDLGPGDRVACNVFFPWEMLRPLLRGATVVAVPDGSSYDPALLLEFLSSRSITETLMTPTLLATLLARHPGSSGISLPRLKTLWLNGEVVTTDLCRRAFEALSSTRLLNVYSSSETHEVAAGDIKTFIDYESRVCPVGPLMDPSHTYILDEAGNRVSVGTPGELYVGGHLLAREYLNLPETTAKAFQMDPFASQHGARMYRTGDMARLLPSGLLEITGRVGGMIKTRGYTVQPGAVEAAIVKHLAVLDCAVVARGDGIDRKLVAYVVPDANETRNRTRLVIDESGYSPVARRALSAHLAHYMIPPIWVELNELPTHGVSGKTDLKALPPPPAPKTPAIKAHREQDTRIKLDTVIKMWASSLNIPTSAISQHHSFFDLGGHSLTLADLASRLRRAFGFPIPLAPLAGNPTLEGHLAAVRAARDGHTAAVQADLPAVLRADCVLPDDIQAKGKAFCRLSHADTVLLTGATGYLGAFLLKSILDSTSAHLLCLVRFTDPQDDCRPAGLARVRKNLVDLGIWDDDMLDRIEVVPGNLARPRLGLAPEAFDELASRIDVIVHAAATVNLVYPYAALRNANVGGAREVLRLASRAGATLHHVSTNGVLPPSTEGWPEDAMLDIDEVPMRIPDGYGQTKWVAEMLVYEARRRGMPVKVYRPGTISGHSITGSTNTYDLLNAVLVESLHLGYAPEVEGWLAEMTPVDYVSTAIVTLANQETGGGRAHHLGDPAPVKAGAVFEDLAALGYPTKKICWDEWTTLWTEKRGLGRGGDEPFTVDILRGGMPTAETLRSVTILKDDVTGPMLEQLGVQRPHIDCSLWETYTRHFYARGWLPRLPRRLKGTEANGNGNGNNISRGGRGPVQSRSRGVGGGQDGGGGKGGRLAGRVAVVTGASSGIGAAVAAALAAEGADVALAARRQGTLEEVRAKLEAQGAVGRLMAHATDVTKREDVELLMRTTREQLGPIDMVVACAGVMYFTLMANSRVEEWERTVEVNCKGVLHCLSATVPDFVERGKGHVVVISSDAGRKVFPGLGVYSASKSFVEATLQSLRLETAGTGLRVTSIQPGNVNTELLGLSTDSEAVKKYGEPTGAKVLDARDVAAAVVFALSQPEHVAVNEVLIEPREEPI